MSGWHSQKMENPSERADFVLRRTERVKPKAALMSEVIRGKI